LRAFWAHRRRAHFRRKWKVWLMMIDFRRVPF